MRLSHITLFVSDIPRSRAFYLALGMPIIVDEPHYCRFIARLDAEGGDETLSIERHDGPVAPAAQIGLEFSSPEALDQYVAGLQARGVQVAEGPVDRSWLWRDARVFDPDRHELMLFFAGKNKLDPPWRVRPGQEEERS
jgi:catechol 2,3-dioxygenase-like lactoylglutathione lyase family enzyme